MSGFGIYRVYWVLLMVTIHIHDFSVNILYYTPIILDYFNLAELKNWAIEKKQSVWSGYGLWFYEDKVLITSL